MADNNFVVKNTLIANGSVIANSSQLSIGSNVVATPSNITVGNSSVNSVINSTAISIGNSSVNSVINSSSFSGTSANSTLFSGLSLTTIYGYITGNSTTAYTNATNYAASNTYLNSTFAQNTAIYANVITYSGYAYSNALAVVASLYTNTTTLNTTIGTVNTAITGNAATAYANAVAYGNATFIQNTSAYGTFTQNTAINSIISNVNSAILANASSAYTNAINYAASNSYVNTYYAPLTGASFSGNVSANIISTISNTATFGNNVYLFTNGNIAISSNTGSYKLTVVANTKGNDGITLENISTNVNSQSVLNLISTGWTGFQIGKSYVNGVAFVYNADNTDIVFSTNSSEKMRLSANGNLGVGLSNPAYLLDMYTTSVSQAVMRITNGNSGAYIASVILATGTPNSYMNSQLVDNSGTPYHINSCGSAVYAFYNDCNQHFWRAQNGGMYGTFDYNGNFLVGDVGTPSGQYSGIGATGFLTRSAVSGYYMGNKFNITWDGTNCGMVIDNSYIGTLINTSDYRIKRDIKSQESASERIMKLNPVKYNLKDISIFKDDGKEKEGFIAHELQEIIPSAVHGEKDSMHESGDINPQSINPLPVLSVLIKAFQELKTEFDQYKLTHP